MKLLLAALLSLTLVVAKAEETIQPDPFDLTNLESKLRS